MKRIGRRKYRPSPLKAFERLVKIQGEAIQTFTRHAGTETQIFLRRIIHKIVRDRLTLAEYFLRRAEEIRRTGRSGLVRQEERDAISSAYYAMYHAARAYHYCMRGYDCNDHRLLKREVESFGGNWRNVADKLEANRGRRNEADYSPYYPLSLAKDAQQALSDAQRVVKLCRREIRKIESRRHP